MSKTSLKPAAPARQPVILPAAAAAIDSEQRALVAADQAVSALARQLNYQGSTDPDVLENSARDAIRRIGAGIFELGGYLLLLKEACAHGKFLPALERLGLGVDAAQRYMAVTRRFANTATSRHLDAIGMSKLVELLPLDDDQTLELAELGQTGELALDDVARMSVKELRAAVREVRAEREADQRLLEGKNKRIDQLEREKGRIALLEGDELLAQMQREAAAILADALGCVRGNLRAALQTLRDDGIKSGKLRAHEVFMAGLVGQLAAELATLREEFNLPDVSNAADQQLMAEVAQWGGQ
ncbi:hypothetical protein [Comamonas sp. NLF-1-9]|uniref:hypothetical protein n=1 Tax=Comamonas sp. NLF-1-9 TaxID=2853163 RepID=UPI001C45A202|nr:hypothetical protein [Comamonas sp. NLF-1-9]QXL84110.1 hypothetical protein KUD94_12850 [Comamonas sp. NLF-1-9]